MTDIQLASTFPFGGNEPETLYGALKCSTVAGLFDQPPLTVDLTISADVSLLHRKHRPLTETTGLAENGGLR